jgi:hypothetical protein
VIPVVADFMRHSRATAHDSQKRNAFHPSGADFERPIRAPISAVPMVVPGRSKKTENNFFCPAQHRLELE